MKTSKFTILLLVLLLPTITHACPMCKDSIPNTDSTLVSSVPAGFNLSVYCMLGGLFGSIGLCAHAIIKGVHSHQRKD